MGAGAKTDPTRMEIADIEAARTTARWRTCCANVCTKLGIRTGFRAVFSAEPARVGR